jgi:hypothetical protein
MGAFQNRVQRRIFGTKGEEVREVWRKLHESFFNYTL